MKKIKFLIVGAGVSGLAFANFLEHEDYLVIEKENEVGGYCRTIHSKGYVWDYAGHFFHFNNEEIKKFFLDNIYEKHLIHNDKNTKIFYGNKLIEYPFQKNIHELEKEEFIDCLYDLFNKEENSQYNNFKEMLYGKFGKSISEKFLIPYNEKLYACELNGLDTDAMGRFFPYADIKEIINNMRNKEDDSYNKKFLYPKDGAVTFINVLRNKLNEKNILLNTEVVKIDINNKLAFTSDGSEIKYEYLINTMPFDNLISRINVDLYKKLKKNLTYNKVLVFNLGFDKKSNDNSTHWMYIPDKEINFYRVGFYDNILKQDKLSMYIEIGFNQSESIDIDKQLEFTLTNLRKMKIINDHKLIDYRAIIMDPAYVHISKESKILLKEYIEILNTRQIYCIGRYGLWKYCSMEDNIIDAMRLASIFNKVNKI